jgi:hypothetical protein
MKHIKSFEILRWNDWDHIIARSIDDFFLTFSIYPNILLANKYTYSQIDFITTINPEKKKNAHRIVDDKIGEYLESLTTDKNEGVGLTSFQKNLCELDFAIEKELKDKEFTLVFDDNPEWGDDNDNLPVTQLDIRHKIVITKL